MNTDNLLKKIQNNQPGTFEELVKIFQKNVINIAYRFVLNREDAEDIAQDVFIQVFHSLSSFQGKSQLSTWIHRISITKSIDFIRNKTRKKRYAPIIDLVKLKNEGKELRSSDIEPSQKLEQSERKIILLKVLLKIPENQRIAISLSKIEGISNKEIAKIMNTSLASVESLIHRAKQSLRKKLEKIYAREFIKNKPFLTVFIIALISQFCFNSDYLKKNLKKSHVIQNVYVKQSVSGLQNK